MRSSFVKLGLLVALIVFPGFEAVASAEEPPWEPPQPSPTSKDWVRLTSGEWLRGEIKSKRDLDFEFDSEELELLHLDWKDVAVIRSPRELTYVFEGGLIVAGPAIMQADSIKVRVGGTIEGHAKTALLSIIEGKPSELNFWSFKASLGFVARSGNTDQSDLNALVKIRRDAPRNRLDVNYNGNFGTLNGSQNVNNHQGNAAFSLFLYRNIFITPLGVSLYSDRFQNIDLQWTLAAGGGIFPVRNSTVEFEIGLGGGYTKTSYVSVEPGQSDTDETGSLIPTMSLDWDLTDDIEWNIAYNGRIGLPDPKNSTHHLSSLFSVDVWSALDFTVSTTWDRVENPTPNADGVMPKPDDFRVAFGLGLDF